MNQPFDFNSSGSKSSANKPLGQLLSEAGLISAQQIELALIEQLVNNSQLKIGEIFAERGWIKQKTADFFVEQWRDLVKADQKYPLVYYFREAGLLDEEQINQILVAQNKSTEKVRFHHLAVQQGWIAKETVDFFVIHLLAPRKKKPVKSEQAFATPYELLKNYIRGETNFQRSQLKRIKLNNVTLKGVNLNYSNLIGAELKQANLSNSSLKQANLSQANLEKAILKEVDFESACLDGVNLTDAHLEGSNFTKANLAEADLRDGYFVNACFSGANLQQVKFQGANFEGALYSTETIFDANFDPASWGMRQIL